MLILGIDPGTAIMGYGLIEKKGSRLLAVDYGCWRTPAHTPMTERLLMLYNDIAACIKNHQPNFVAVEELFLIVTPLLLSLSDRLGESFY